MFPSSALCRAQEIIQRNRSANADLANVRILAGKAAAAWGKEAAFAEQRERRKGRVKPAETGISVRQANTNAMSELSVSENPDRGLASS
ncbi:MAG: hypothetical protein EP350_04635 [Alphaproteobacteria bacterium]|nr:MAG: hypothetical protein EP350_04635 [Alphaproteobacteria bacterium]